MTEPKSAYSVDGKESYKGSSKSPEERVKDLLSRMTLEEKVAQMMGLWNDKNETLVNEMGILKLWLEIHYEMKTLKELFLK